MKKKLQRIYDGALFCSSCKACPVVEHDKIGKRVILRDPAKPEQGRFEMSVEEYNVLIKHAKAI